MFSDPFINLVISSGQRYYHVTLFALMFSLQSIKTFIHHSSSQTSICSFLCFSHTVRSVTEAERWRRTQRDCIVVVVI